MSVIGNAQQFVGLTQDQANRIVSAVKIVEGLNPTQGRPSTPSTYRPGSTLILKGKITTALNFDSTLAPALQKGQFQPYCLSNPYDDTTTDAATSDGPFDCWGWNLPDPTTLAVGTRVICVFSGGRWWVIGTLPAILLGFVSDSVASIAAGATGSIVIRDDQGLNSHTLTGVRSLGMVVRNQAVVVSFDLTENEPFCIPIQTPLYCLATATIAYQATGTVNVVDSTRAAVGGTLTAISGCYAAYRTIAKGELCLMWWDYNAPDQFYTIPLAATFIGQLSGTSVSQGSQATFNIYNDRFASLSFTIASVTALHDMVRYDYANLFWDLNENEFYALPLGRPCIGVPGTTIVTGTPGSAAIQDSSGASLSVSVTGVNAPFGNLAASEPCLIFWDYKQQHWYGFPSTTSGVCVGTLGGTLSHGSSASFSPNSGTGGPTTVYDYLLASGHSLANGSKVIVGQDVNDGKWYVISTAGC